MSRVMILAMIQREEFIYVYEESVILATRGLNVLYEHTRGLKLDAKQ